MDVSRLVSKLSDKKALTPDEMSLAMESIVSGRASEAVIEDFLLRMREKGETVAEVLAAARVMRAHSLRLPKVFPDLLDTCGTGGDGSQTLNVSTLAAIVACATGASVAKHGNRSVSSVCGSADLLESLGVRIDLGPDEVAQSLDRTGFGFFFAPIFHPATKHASSARRKIGGKTLFNLLGPLANPACAPYQLLGVYDKKLVPLFAEVLRGLDVHRALVVCGEGGLDEISLSGPTLAAEVSEKGVREFSLTPEDFGADPADAEEFRCSTKAESLAAAEQVLDGHPGAKKRMVCVNAAAALWVAGRAASFREGYEASLRAVDAGIARKKLSEIVRHTQLSAKGSLR